MAFKEPSFDSVVVDETFGPVEVEIDEHFIKSYAFALDDYHPWYFGAETPFGGRIASQLWVVKELMWLCFTTYDPNAVLGLHQEQDIWLHAPVNFGSRLTLTGSYVDKYTRRGKGYVVLDAEALDEQGNLLVRQRSTEIMRIPAGIRLGTGSAQKAGRRVQGAWPKDCRPVARATPQLKPGTPLEPFTRLAPQDQSAVYSGALQNFRNVHTDIRIEQGAGFKDSLPQGLMGNCWVAQMLSNFFGCAWVESGWRSMSYLQPIYPADRLTCRGVVSEVAKDAGWHRMELEMWTENQDGVMTTAGWGGATLTA